MTPRQDRARCTRPRRVALAILLAASTLAARAGASGAPVPAETTLHAPGPRPVLEDLLERRVDLVTDKALRPELRPYVEREAVHV